MIIVTIDHIPGMRVSKVLGLVSGSTVRARNIGRDIVAGFRNIGGGEVTEYTKLLAESREESLQRLGERSAALGANAVVGMRFVTSMVAQGGAEILSYGTAVVVEEEG